jgi:hypothetical protein
LEVIMLARRIVMSACALCIAVPSAAVASAAADPPQPAGPYGVTATIDPSAIVKAKGPYGTTATIDPKTILKAKGPYGTTATIDPKTILKAEGPYGTTATIDPKTIVKARGPYGATLKADPQHTPRASAHPASASNGDGINDWRTAAISEATLLAALALGSVWLLSARRHAPRPGM